MRITLRVVEVPTNGLGDHHENLRRFVHKLREPQVPDSLLGEVCRADALDALKLTEVGRVAQKIEEEQLGDVTIPVLALFLFV